MTHEEKNMEANPAGLPTRHIGHFLQKSTPADLTSASLPENAYHPLPPGEVYCPVVPTSASPFEATRRSVGWGLLLCALFTIASAYSGLKVGQVMETAIPISILAIGLARLGRRRSNLLENVIITSIGGSGRSCGGRRHFHATGALHAQVEPSPAANDFYLPGWWLSWRAFLDPAEKIFCA